MDLIERADLIADIKERRDYTDTSTAVGRGEYIALNKALTMIGEQPTVNQWIPIKTRPMDEEERNYYSEHFGYDIEYEEAIMFDCKMPEDGQEVWVCYESGIVSQDVCDNDEGMSGLEGNGDWDCIVAWMPFHKPEPWKGEQE